MSYKYIILEKGNMELPFIFPKNMVHAHVAEAIRAMMVMESLQLFPPSMRTDRLKRDILSAIHPVSAGEATFEMISTHGFSETLNLESRPQDTDFLRRFPYTGGVKGE